jgi:hypothetical protein
MNKLPHCVWMIAILILLSCISARATDWSQPEVGCPKEVILRPSPYVCPDLSEVSDPFRDWPASFTPEDIELWSKHRKLAMRYCRAQEVARREELQPGQLAPIAVEVSWMILRGSEHTEEKLAAIERASSQYGVPEQILLGALTQESFLAELGIADDGGNFSCGIGQLNFQEWCTWVERQSLSTKQKLGWPVEKIETYKKAHGVNNICASTFLDKSLIRPFYRLGVKRLNGLPDYRLLPEHMRGIEYGDVIGGFPEASQALQKIRYEAARSFTLQCSDATTGIESKAFILRGIFNSSVPHALREVQKYAAGEAFKRSCQSGAKPSVYYPLHTGWLLADAVYNAGPRIVSAIQWYLRLDPKSADQLETWVNFSPKDLIAALHGAGVYNPRTDLLEHYDFSGRKLTHSWFKACIVQRHVARVIQYATLPGFELAQSLEDKSGCQKSVFDSDGNLIESKVPLSRQTASGRREP